MFKRILSTRSNTTSRRRKRQQQQQQEQQTPEIDMGNSQSSPGNSIRSRASRKANGGAEDKRTARMSKAVSIYQTPPGSLDIDEGSNKTQSKSSRSHTPNEIEEPVANEEPERTMPGAEPLEQKPGPPLQRKWKAGFYSLANARGGTSMDLSAADNKSVIGFPSHEGKNQQVSVSKF